MGVLTVPVVALLCSCGAVAPGTATRGPQAAATGGVGVGSSAPARSASSSPRPTPSSLLQELRPAKTAGRPLRTLLSVPHASGSVTLPAFTTKAGSTRLSYACLGPGIFEVPGVFDVQPCDGAATRAEVSLPPGVHHLVVKTGPDVEWRLLLEQ